MVKCIKKNILIFVGLMACQFVQAFDIETNGIYYNISSTDLTAEVTYGTNMYIGAVYIPSTVEFRGKQLSVTKIGKQAFKNCSKLTTVSLSEGIVSIEDQAFYGCSDLESITLPTSLKRIDGYNTFAFCEKLKEIPWPEGLEYIGGYAFYGCEALTEISIPRSVHETGQSIFAGCNNLKTVFIPKNITELKNMFFKCANLETIKVECALPPSVDNNSSFFGKNVLLNATLYVPKNASKYYKNNEYWKNFFVIEEDEKLGTCYYLDITCGKNGQVDIGEKHISSSTSPTLVGGIEGDNIELTFVPLSKYGSGKKYRVKSFTMNNIEMKDKIEDNVYRSKFTEDATISVEFIRYYDVTINSDGDEGTIIINGENIHNNSKAFTINEGDTLKMHLNIEEGYYAKAIQTGDLGRTINWGGFKQVNDTMFVLEYPTDFTVSFTYPKIFIQLYSSCKGNGVFYTNGEPITSKSVWLNTGCYYFDDVNLKCIPEQGWHLTSLLIDDVEVVDKVINNEYNFIAKSHNTIKITCTFEEGEFSDRDNAIAANAVSDLINAISMVEYSEICKERIDAARSAYEALTEKQKALVSNLDILTTAQQTYDTLKAAAEKLATDKAVFDKYKSEIMAIIEALAKDDESDAVKEIIRKAIKDIDALEYEETISLDDNKAKVQSFVTSVNEAVENQRIEDQKLNGIEELEFAERYNIYDLNGRKITNSMLKSGLYIRNGKKVVIK